VKYTKRAFTFDEQADQLLARGLVADRQELPTRLRSVSYYRLSGYWHPFRRADDEFVSGTTLGSTLIGA
jgi:abortive infection bacteriophage resistance protein